MLVKSYYKVYKAFPDPDYFYVQNEYAGTNTFTLQKSGTPATTDLAYSKDKSTWTTFDLTQTQNTVSLAQGEKLYFRSTTGLNSGASSYVSFFCSENYSIGGLVATLFDYENIETFNTIPNYGCCYAFCKPNAYSKLISAENLKFTGITTVNNGGLQNAFRLNSQMTKAPDMSSITTLGNAALMSAFQTCSALTEVPDLSGLTTITGSSVLNSTFDGCTSLTAGLDLTKLNNVSFAYPNTSIFSRMYASCSSLNIATAPNISAWYVNQFENWLAGAAAIGVVKKPAALTITADSNSGVPTGWGTENY